MHQIFTNAVKDNLTGLYTRDILNPLFDTLSKKGRFSLLMIDIDNFKLINDCNGHIRGDKVLAALAVFLKEYVKKGYIVRMGGDEFVIILPRNGRDKSIQFADELFRGINQKIFKGDPDLTLSLSAGIAFYPDDCRVLERLLKKADERLYRAKRNGRNQYCVKDGEESGKPVLLGEPTRLIGREKVFLLMREKLDEVVKGKSKVLFVKGEEGVGKTFLCERFLEYVKIRGGAIKRIKPVNVPFYSSYNAIIEIVKGLFEREDEIRTFIKNKRIEYGKELLTLLYPKRINEETSRRYVDYRILKSIISLIKELFFSYPFLVIFIDDFENVDTSSFSLLEHLWEGSFDVPVLFLIAAREGRRYRSSNVIKNIKRNNNASVVSLKRFKERDYGNFVKAVLKGVKVSRDLISFLFKKTEGNPLFTKELLNSIVSKRIISKKKGVWLLNKTKDVSIISDSLKTILEARIQDLNEEEKGLLTLSSVIGKNFDISSLKEIQKIEMESIIGLLRRPIEFEIIDDYEDGRFSFRLFYREMFYERIPGTEKKFLHKKVAQALERQDKKETKKLFYHYNLAGEKYKAGYIAEKICRNEIKKGNFKDAKLYVDFLLKKYDRQETRYSSILSLAGKCYEMNGHFEKAIELYRTLSEVAPTLTPKAKLEISELYNKMGKSSLALDELLKISIDTSPISCTVLNRIALTLLRSGELKKAEEYVKKSIELSKRYRIREKEAEGYDTIGGIFLYRSEYELSEDFLMKSLRIYKDLKKSNETALVMNRLGIVKWYQGKLAEAETIIEKAVKTFRTCSMIEEENRAYTNLGILNEAMGRWQTAKSYYKKSIEMAAFLKLTTLFCRNYNNLGTLLLKEGRYEDAICFLKKTINLKSKLGDGIELGSSYHNLGAAYMFLGDYKTSSYFLEKARKLFDEKGIIGMRIDNLNTLFELFIYRKEFSKAAGLIPNINELIDSNGTNFQKAQFYRVMARYMRTEKKLDESRKFARMSIDILNNGEEKYELGKSLLELSLTLFEEGDEGNGKKELMKSRANFKELGAEKALERVTSIMKKWQKSK